MIVTAMAWETFLARRKNWSISRTWGSRVSGCYLNLARFREHTPVEMFGNTAFPKIDERPYFLSLGPYGFHWFRLTRGGYQ